VRLGEYFAERGIHFDGLIAGTLRRHKQTLEGILQGMNHAGEHLSWEGLNEYDSEAVIATVHPHKLQKPTRPRCTGTTSACCATASRNGWPARPAGRHAQLRRLRGRRRRARWTTCAPTTTARTCLIVTSGGPISTAVGLRAGDAAGNDHRAEPAHPQHLGHRIRLHSQAPHAGRLQRHPHLDAPAYRELGDLH
jgi:hypothetical protein